MAGRRLGGAVLGLAALVAGLVGARPAQAQDKARLVYVRGAGAEDCPEEVDLRLWVIARLGYDPFSPQADRVVLARVEGEQPQLRGSVELVDRDGKSLGRRELASQTERCQELARTLALSISLVIDPERASSATPTATKPVEPPPPAQPPSVPVVVAPPAPAPPREQRWFASLSGNVATGALPALAGGVTAGLGVRLAPLSFGLEARGLLSLPRQLETRGSLSGSLLGGGLVACWHLERFAACVLGQLAAQRLGTRDVSVPASSTGPYAGVGPRLTYRLPLGAQIGLVLGLEGLLNLSRNTAIFSGIELWRTPPLAGSLSFGIDTRFL